MKHNEDMKLIDKDAVVAEIERLKADALQKKSQCKRSGLERIMHQISTYNKMLSLIDTIEVKEVDLNEEIEKCLKKHSMLAVGKKDFTDIAKHFYERGRQHQVGKVWHDMSEAVENGRNILIIDPDGFYGAVLRKGGTALKNHNKERYTSWAYIDDLIRL